MPILTLNIYSLPTESQRISHYAATKPTSERAFCELCVQGQHWATLRSGLVNYVLLEELASKLSSVVCPVTPLSSATCEAMVKLFPGCHA